MWGWGNVYTEPHVGMGLGAAQAQSQDVLLSRQDPLGARDWDVLADARQAVWEASVFYPPFMQWWRTMQT